MLKVYATPFMDWFRIVTDNEPADNKITALKEFKEALFKATGKKLYFVDNKEVTLSDEDVVTYKFNS